MKRAYGSEPVLLGTSPISPLLAPAHKKKRFGAKSMWLTGLLVVLVVGSAGGLLAWRSFGSKDVIPSAIRGAVSFPLYQPTNLPAGLRVDQGSFQAAGGVVTFSILYNGGDRLVITEQARPAGVDFAEFHEQIMDKKDISTYIGSGATGQFDDTDFASVVA